MGAYHSFCPANLNIDKEVEELLNMIFYIVVIKKYWVTNSSNGSLNSTVLKSDQSQAQSRDHIQNYEESIIVCS